VLIVSIMRVLHGQRCGDINLCINAKLWCAVPDVTRCLNEHAALYVCSPVTQLTCHDILTQCAIVSAAANCSGDLIDNDFISNFATSGGGVWQTLSSNYIVFNNRFEGNNATTGSGGYEMTNCTVEFSLNQFTFNKGQEGAGLYLGDSTGNIDSCYFDNNTANLYAGALFMDTDTGNVTNCVFDSNYAGSIGGAIYGQRGVGNIASSTFSGNSARYGASVYWNSWAGLINKNNVLATADLLDDEGTGNGNGIQGTDSFDTGNTGSTTTSSSGSVITADGVTRDTSTGTTTTSPTTSTTTTSSPPTSSTPASTTAASSSSSSSSSSTTTGSINVG